jgi:hypothetical protein
MMWQNQQAQQAQQQQQQQQQMMHQQAQHQYDPRCTMFSLWFYSRWHHCAVRCAMAKSARFASMLTFTMCLLGWQSTAAIPKLRAAAPGLECAAASVGTSCAWAAADVPAVPAAAAAATQRKYELVVSPAVLMCFSSCWR